MERNHVNSVSRTPGITHLESIRRQFKSSCAPGMRGRALATDGRASLYLTASYRYGGEVSTGSWNVRDGTALIHAPRGSNEVGAATPRGRFGYSKKYGARKRWASTGAAACLNALLSPGSLSRLLGVVRAPCLSREGKAAAALRRAPYGGRVAARPQ